MARYRGWKPKKKDVEEFNKALADAQYAIDTSANVLSVIGFQSETIESVLPVVRTSGVDTPEELHDEFLTRDDFNRYKRYLGRISRAFKSDVRKGTVPIVKESTTNQLLSFYVDENGAPEESAFMRSEQRLNISNRNRDAVKILQSRGIEMAQKNVVVKNAETGEFETVTDEWRHPIKVWVPASPNNETQYLEEIEKDPSLAIITPDEAVGGVIDWFGDMVPVTQEKKHRVSPKALAQSHEVDARTANRTDLYFSNYEAIVSTTLPDEIADELSDYITAVQDLPPAEKAAIYEEINAHGDDAGSIEYLYLDTSGTMVQKINNILTFWRRRIAPKLDVEVPDGLPKQSWVKQQLRNSGYIINSGQSIYGEYQKRRAEGTAYYATLESMSNIFGVVKAPAKKRRKRG